MRTNVGPFTAADLPTTLDGRVYHLHLPPEHLADNVIIVGDPGRVAMAAGLGEGKQFAVLEEIEFDVEHRGLRTITGRTQNGLRLTLTTSGMGTPSLEIVLNELLILREIDLGSRSRKQDWKPMNIIRVGTSGGLQSDTKLGTCVISRYALGMDNAGLLYEVETTKPMKTLERAARKLLKRSISRNSRFYGKISPYAAAADTGLTDAMVRIAIDLGIAAIEGVTISNAGFFAAQGRDVQRLKLVVPDIDRHFADCPTRLPDLRFENMEMETALLFHIINSLGHHAASICLAIANRVENSFDPNYERNVFNAFRVAVGALESLSLDS